MARRRSPPPARPAGGRPRGGPRILGPYSSRGGRQHKLIIVGPDGTRSAFWYSSAVEAQAAADEARGVARALSLTCAEALERYQGHQRAAGLRPRTITTAESAIRRLLGDVSRPLDQLTPRVLEQRVEALRAGETACSVDYAASCVRQARTWLRWCAGQGWLSRRALEALCAVQVAGRRRRGKPQLLVEEARRFSALALERARAGDDGALAALGVLWLGVRAEEILARQVRHVDAGLLWIPEAKTEAGVRRVELPGELLELLEEQGRGRPGQDWLFPSRGKRGSRSGHREKTWLQKVVAGLCRDARVPVVCPHGLRGTHSTLAESAGVSSHVVAASLGHTSPEVTGRHYTAPGVREERARRRALEVLRGGKGS